MVPSCSPGPPLCNLLYSHPTFLINHLQPQSNRVSIVFLFSIKSCWNHIPWSLSSLAPSTPTVSFETLPALLRQKHHITCCEHPHVDFVWTCFQLILAHGKQCSWWNIFNFIAVVQHSGGGGGGGGTHCVVTWCGLQTLLLPSPPVCAAPLRASVQRCLVVF